MVVFGGFHTLTANQCKPKQPRHLLGLFVLTLINICVLVFYLGLQKQKHHATTN